MVPIACTAILALAALLGLTIVTRNAEQSELLRELITEVRALRPRPHTYDRLGSHEGDHTN